MKEAMNLAYTLIDVLVYLETGRKYTEAQLREACVEISY